MDLDAREVRSGDLVFPPLSGWVSVADAMARAGVSAPPEPRAPRKRARAS